MIKGYTVDFEFFKNEVKQAQQNHPLWFGMESDQKATDPIIADAEAKLSTKLPDDYKKFIYEYGGGYFAFSNVYSLEIGSDWNLIDVNNKYADIRGEHLLISENGLGDFYGFKITSGVCESKIYFYDHEIQSWQLSPYGNLFEYLKASALSN